MRRGGRGHRTASTCPTISSRTERPGCRTAARWCGRRRDRCRTPPRTPRPGTGNRCGRVHGRCGPRRQCQLLALHTLIRARRATLSKREASSVNASLRKSKVLLASTASSTIARRRGDLDRPGAGDGHVETEILFVLADLATAPPPPPAPPRVARAARSASPRTPRPPAPCHSYDDRLADVQAADLLGDAETELRLAEAHALSAAARATASRLRQAVRWNVVAAPDRRRRRASSVAIAGKISGVAFAQPRQQHQRLQIGAQIEQPARPDLPGHHRAPHPGAAEKSTRRPSCPTRIHATASASRSMPRSVSPSKAAAAIRVTPARRAASIHSKGYSRGRRSAPSAP